VKLPFRKRHPAQPEASAAPEPEVAAPATEQGVFGGRFPDGEVGASGQMFAAPAPGFKRVAAIDCGTNTIRLLIADVDAAGNQHEVLRRVEIVRLGEGVDRTGVLSQEALARTFAMTKEYAELIRDSGAQQGRFVATSATRDATNRDEFVAGIRALIGAAPEVITGEEEAWLSFMGATRTARTPGPYLVVDLGGGSTELVLGHDEPEAAISLNIGSVRLTERWLRHDPPERREVRAATATVTGELVKAEAALDLHRVRTLIGVAGSITTVAAFALGLDNYDRNKTNGAVIPVDEMLVASINLLHMTRAERSALGIMQHGREDVIGAGALIWAQIIARVGRDVKSMGGELQTVLISESDLLDGLALSMAPELA